MRDLGDDFSGIRLNFRQVELLPMAYSLPGFVAVLWRAEITYFPTRYRIELFSHVDLYKFYSTTHYLYYPRSPKQNHINCFRFELYISRRGFIVAFAR